MKMQTEKRMVFCFLKNPKEKTGILRILSDNLAKWCLTWRIEMRERLSQLVKEVDDEN